MKKAIIHISRLSVASNHRILFKDLSLEIQEGEITLLVGGSGSGKTVLMKILASLITPSTPHFHISGTIEIEGKKILPRSMWNSLPPVGIVFQEYGLFDLSLIHI